MVFLGARQEEVYVRRQRALVRVEVHQVALRTAETLAPWDTISGNLIAKLFKQEQALPVIVEGRVVGLLTYHDLRRVYRHGDSPLTVAHVMRTSFPCLRLRDTLWVALQEMNACQLAALPVVDNGLYLGVVRLDDINHAWRFAMRRKRGLSTLVSGD
jgi:CBS domain-containing protein